MPDKDESKDASVVSAKIPPKSADAVDVTLKYQSPTIPWAKRASEKEGPATLGNQHEQCVKRMAEWASSASAVDWRVHVHRRAPAYHHGRRVRTGLLHSYPIQTYQEIIEQIKRDYGGGSYFLMVMDENGVQQHRTLFSVSADEFPPRFPDEIAGPQNGDKRTPPEAETLSRHRISIEEHRLRAQELQAKAEYEEQKRSIEERRIESDERREKKYMQPLEEMRRELRELQDRADKRAAEIQEKSDRRIAEIQATHREEMRELKEQLALGSKNSSEVMAKAIEQVGGVVQALFAAKANGNGNNPIADAMRDAAKSNSDLMAKFMELSLANKGNDKSDERLMALLEGIAFKKMDQPENSVNQFIKAMQMGEERAFNIMDRAEGGGDSRGPTVPYDPNAGMLENLAGALVNWFSKSQKGQQAAAGLGSTGPSDLQGIAERLAPIIAQRLGVTAAPPAPQATLPGPSFNILGEGPVGGASPPAPMLQPVKQNPVDNLRVKLNETLRIAVEDITASRSPQQWVDYALANVPPDFLDRLIAADDASKLALLRQSADAAQCQALEGALMNHGSAGFGKAMARLGEERRALAGA